jgi:transcriptional regulator with XRE-family HTH domain
MRGVHHVQATRWIVAALKTIREARGWTQMELASRLGVSQGTVAQLETGRRPDPQFSTIARWAEGLELEVMITIQDGHTGEKLIIPVTGAGVREVDD